MKMFILWFFAVLGFIFFWIIVGVIYFIVADPFNLRPVIKMLWQETSSEAASIEDISASTNETEPVGNTVSADGTATKTGGPTAEQSAALKSVGLGANAAASVTPEQEACFVKILGQARVDAVKAGAIPSASEFFSVRGCM